ncbi:peptidase M30, hyicolysin [Brachyspira murdochii]|uniref:Peptidase M30, hyicolysin n=1 Tax=Brachyspira murdochii TaxID=84378 RepID=A0ABX5B5V7_9SPIR|nr:peptidase M30, hyicolysin [Brachyspira murdochii]PPS22515.1 peptidase M30, hyicolysin [Brachyspira murdochii]
MRKYLLLILFIIIHAFVLNAYESLNEVLKTPVSYNIYKGKNTEKVFNAVRYINNNYSKEIIKAKNIYSTSRIDIYLENGLQVNDRYLQNIILETSKIYEMEEYLYGKLKGKLTLLIMDINGGFTGDKPYMQGYSILDGLDKIKNDTENIIFLDYINGWENIESVVNTIAHELHHVIHYSSLENKSTSSFDVWVDEALSEAAVIAYRGKLPKNRLDYYNTDSMYLITKGDYFVNWNQGYTVHKYATVSLFMYWLGIHSQNGFEIYKDIANAPKEYKGTYMAILYAANKNIKEFQDWSELYAAWLKANYKNDASGIYGYKGLITTKPKIITTQYNCPMAPGSAIYVKGDFMSDDKLLRYAELGDDTYVVYNPDVNTKGKDRYLIVNSSFYGY